jgi:hypothetical protein
MIGFRRRTQKKIWSAGELAELYNRFSEGTREIEELLGNNLLTALLSVDPKTNKPYINFLVAKGGDYKKRALRNLPKIAGDLPARYTLRPRPRIPRSPV